MEFPKDNKLMLLFLSEKNPIWKELLAPHAISQDNLVTLLGIAHATLPNWKKGGRMDKDLVNKLFLRIEDRINGAEVGYSSNKPRDKEKLVNKSGHSVGKIEKPINNGYKKLNADQRVDDLRAVLAEGGGGVHGGARMPPAVGCSQTQVWPGAVAPGQAERARDQSSSMSASSAASRRRTARKRPNPARIRRLPPISARALGSGIEELVGTFPNCTLPCGWL